MQGIQHALAAPATERAEHRHQGHAEKCNTRVILTATQWPPTVPLHTEEDTRPTLMKDFWDALSIAMASLDWPLSREETILNRLRRTRTTGIRSTGLICKGPKTLFMFVFGKLCLYLFCFVFFCLYLSFFVFICLYLSLFVFVCLLFVTASCCSTWDLASSSTSTIHRRGLSPPWCEFVF